MVVRHVALVNQRAIDHLLLDIGMLAKTFQKQFRRRPAGKRDGAERAGLQIGFQTRGHIIRQLSGEIGARLELDELDDSHQESPSFQVRPSRSISAIDWLGPHVPAVY